MGCVRLLCLLCWQSRLTIDRVGWVESVSNSTISLVEIFVKLESSCRADENDLRNWIDTPLCGNTSSEGKDIFESKWFWASKYDSAAGGGGTGTSDK